MAPSAPSPSLNWCLFLDVDGTLIELTDTPFQTQASAHLKRLLQDVSARLGGALALVSGRSIAYLDTLFAPLSLPIAGLHGVERRSPAATATSDRSASAGAPRDRAPPDHAPQDDVLSATLDGVRVPLTALVASHPGTLLEDKGSTIAVHYRLAPQFEPRIRAAVDAIAMALGPRYHVQAGNMMLEIKPRAFSKGQAIAAFLDEPPFAGRIPVFVGDDLTDVDGFRVVEARGGISVGVGNRVQGQCHLEDPNAVRQWLGSIAAQPR